MWAKGADGGQACTHACPRAVPGARERIVHMSSAWLFGAGGGGCAVGGASLGVSMQGARLGAEELGRAACEARPAIGRRGLGFDQRLQIGAAGQDRLDGAVVR